jgi:hypothetical protein
VEQRRRYVEWNVPECTKGLQRQLMDQDVGLVDDNRLAPAKLPPESSRQRGIDLYGNNVPRAHDQLSSQDAGAGTDFEHKLIGIDARSSNQLLG